MKRNDSGEETITGFWNSLARAPWESKAIHTYSLLVPSSPHPIAGGQIYSESDSPYTGMKTQEAGFLNKEAQATEGS